MKWRFFFFIFFPKLGDTHTHAHTCINTLPVHCERIHLQVTSWITWISRRRLWVEPLNGGQIPLLANTSDTKSAALAKKRKNSCVLISSNRQHPALPTHHRCPRSTECAHVPKCVGPPAFPPHPPLLLQVFKKVIFTATCVQGDAISCHRGEGARGAMRGGRCPPTGRLCHS